MHLALGLGGVAGGLNLALLILDGLAGDDIVLDVMLLLLGPKGPSGRPIMVAVASVAAVAVAVAEVWAATIVAVVPPARAEEGTGNARPPATSP